MRLAAPGVRFAEEMAKPRCLITCASARKDLPISSEGGRFTTGTTGSDTVLTRSLGLRTANASELHAIRAIVGTEQNASNGFLPGLFSMVADEARLLRQSYWSAALAVGDAEWLEARARGLGLRRFEIREAPPPLQDEENVRTFFLGWQNQSKAP